MPLHLNGLGDCAHFEREVEAHGFADSQQYVGLRQRLESLELRLDLVGPAREVRDAVQAIALGDRRPRVVCRDIPCRD